MTVSHNLQETDESGLGCRPGALTGRVFKQALRVLDQNPTDPNHVIEFHSGSNALISTFGLATGWNREHHRCNSDGIDSVEPAYSDFDNLRVIDKNQPVDARCLAVGGGFPAATGRSSNGGGDHPVADGG